MTKNLNSFQETYHIFYHATQHNCMIKNVIGFLEWIQIFGHLVLKAGYQEAFDISKTKLNSTRPIRLSLALDFPVFYYEILSSPDGISLGQTDAPLFSVCLTP